MSEIVVPKYHELMLPTLKALKDLGGSGTISEIMEQMVKNEGFSEEVQQYAASDDPTPVLHYRSAWARSYLKKCGTLESSQRGVWSLTEIGENFTQDDVYKALQQIRKARYQQRKLKRAGAASEFVEDIVENEPDSQIAENSQLVEAEESNDSDWRKDLMDVLYGLTPAAFERMCQRLLRESGFIKVEVTGRTGDGGLDGVGILRMNLVSFRVHFQCKRYRGSVSSAAMRDFRGATVGRSDRGIFITTGRFTKDAQEEANRDGAALIDLIDGETLCDLLYDLKLGVSERIVVDRQWFMGI